MACDRPSWERQGVAGAIIGGAISGTAAIIKGKSFTEVLAATAGGAVEGAIAAVGGKIVIKLASGFIGGGLGNYMEQRLNVAFNNQNIVDYSEVGVNAMIGSATNGVTESIAKGINSFAKDILGSSSTRQSIEIDIKNHLKDSGKQTTKRMIQKSVDEKVDESIKAVSKVIDLSTNTIGYSVGFYNYILSDEDEE